MKCYNTLGGLFIAVCGVKARTFYPLTNVGSRVVLARAYQEDGQMLTRLENIQLLYPRGLTNT